MTYAKRKESARQEAIEWQQNFPEAIHYWSTLMEAQNHFEIIGKRYGLLKEFRANGIL